MLTLALVPMLALHISLPSQEAARRTGIQPYTVEWENDDLRIGRVILAPAERVTAESPAGSVIVYLTADADGRMPPAEAAWHQAGPIELENRGRARFEALVIQFKRTIPTSTAAATPSYSSGGVTRTTTTGPAGYYGYANWMDYAYREPVKTETLVEKAGVKVTKVRQPAAVYLEPADVDANDRVVVYLRGGYAWPSVPSYYGPMRVRRGDVRVLNANTPYALSNAGADPSEFILIERR